MNVPEIKQPHELLALGGVFYTMGEESWCDTPLDSWKLVFGVGFVRQDDTPPPSRPPAEGKG